MNTDTPLPPDEPAGENPPDGAMLDYWLQAPVTGPVTLEILDAAGQVVRRYSSEDPAPPVKDEGTYRPTGSVPQALPAKPAGMHRFVWDLHYAPPATDRLLVPDAGRPPRHAAPAEGAVGVAGPVHGDAGGGTVRSSQPLVIRMDPRVKTPREGLEEQFALSMRLYDAIARVHAKLPPTAEPAEPRQPRSGGDPLRQLHTELLTVYEALQDVDVAPAAAVSHTAEDLLKQADTCCGVTGGG